MKYINPVSSKRWEIAQKSEKEYWQGFDDEKLSKEESERHKKKSVILIKEWGELIKITKNTKILQIGCGPEDVITHFVIGKKYAIDPLADFYKSHFKTDYTGLIFLKGRGEELPFEDKFFDIVILANVLDHVESPKKVLLEIKRVLKDEGIFHFENLFYQKKFLILAKIWGFMKKLLMRKIFNIHHPFMFTLENLKRITYNNFSILHEDIGREIAYYENFNELKKLKRKDKNLKTKILAFLGLYGTINYIAICRKNLSNGV